MPNARVNACFLLACALAACGSEPVKEAEKAEEQALVRVAPATLQKVQREIPTTGFLESEHRDEISARVAGRIRSLPADTGTKVTKGQLLAELDDREALSAIEQLRVQLDARKVDEGLAELEVEAAARRVEKMTLEARKAKAEYERQASMAKEFVSPKALDESQITWQAAEQAAKVAEFNRRKSELELKRLGSTLAELEAKIRENEVRLEHHRIVAPFDGVIVTRMVADGANIAAGTKLFEIIDPRNLVAYLDRPQSELELVRNAREVRFTTDAIPGREFAADVDLVSPSIRRETGHFRVRMRVRADDAQLLLHGMFVRARILAEEQREALMVPKAAMLSEGNVAVVMAVRGGKATRVDLDPGLELQDRVECRNRGDGGLQPGEMVIVSGHEDLKNQSPVRVAQ